MLPSKDRAATATAWGAGQFKDRRSYLAKNGHEYLFGQDRSTRRHELFEKCHGLCAVCGEFAPEDGAPGFHGELHHVGCYCLGCIEWRCGQLKNKCHRHRTPGFQN